MTHSSDTLFLVDEPDYTMRAEDEAARQQWQEAVEAEAYGLESLQNLGSIIQDSEVRENAETVPRKRTAARTEATSSFELIECDTQGEVKSQKLDVKWQTGASSSSGKDRNEAV